MSKKLIRIRGEGNFLISSPHNIKVKRVSGEHLAETNINKLISLLLKKLGKKRITAINWNSKNAKKTKKLLPDPNYYPVKDLDNSLWYNYLKGKYKDAKEKGKDNELFLVDLHGMDDNKDYDLIIGFRALKKYMPRKKHRKIIANLLEVMEAFCYRYKLKIGYNVLFKGYINEEYYTVSQQSNSIGIPAIQIELSNQLRKRLVEEKVIFSQFAKTLNKFYKLNLEK
jgi:hypothetical protein